MVHPIYASPTLWHHNAASSYSMPRIRQVTAGANHISRFKTPLSYLSTFLYARNISTLLVDALRTLPLNYYNLKAIPVVFIYQYIHGDTS